MGTADRIERERQAKRAMILEAARELFLERGYDAVTVREIAQRIEHSTTAVYVHFKDKRDLMEQMVAEDFAKFEHALRGAAAVEPASARLRELGKAYLRFALTLPRHYQLLFLTPSPPEARHEQPDAEAPGIAGYMALVHTVQQAIDEGTFRAELTDARALAQVIWAAMHGLVSLYIVMGEVKVFQWREPEAQLELLMGSLMRGFARQPEAEPPPSQRSRDKSKRKAR